MVPEFAPDQILLGSTAARDHKVALWDGFREYCGRMDSAARAVSGRVESGCSVPNGLKV